MTKLIGLVFSPLFFGLAFLAPLFAEIVQRLELGMANHTALILGLVFGGSLGLLAQIRGSWIWLK